MAKPTHYEMANAVCEAASGAIEVAENIKHGRMVVDQIQHKAIQRRAECLEAAHQLLRSLDSMQKASDLMRVRAG